MGLSDKSILVLDRDDELMTSMWFPMVQKSAEEEKVGGGIDEGGELHICYVRRMSAGIKEGMDPVNLGIFGKSLQ